MEVTNGTLEKNGIDAGPVVPVYSMPTLCLSTFIHILSSCFLSDFLCMENGMNEPAPVKVFRPVSATVCGVFGEGEGKYPQALGRIG